MIGVFDSGVGGLGVLREIRALLPDGDLVYLADQANAPYGERSLVEVQALAEAAARRLIGLGAATVVVACNTASAAALRTLRARHPDTTFVGMEPAVKPAAAATASGVVAVLATPATFQAEVFDALVARFAEGVRVIPRPCPGWSAAVEDLIWDADDMVRGPVEAVVAAGADTLVLGCTHYSFLVDAIAAVTGPGITVLDPAPAVARQVARVAEGPGSGSTGYLTTGDPQRLSLQVRHLLGLEVVAAHLD
jgi:glutamate racemase